VIRFFLLEKQFPIWTISTTKSMTASTRTSIAYLVMTPAAGCSDFVQGKAQKPPHGRNQAQVPPLFAAGVKE
jgi:hypothetical protein